MATPPNRLSQVDQALFILRWLLVVCTVTLSLAMPWLVPDAAAVLRQRLFAAALLGALFALVGMRLHQSRTDSPMPGYVSIALDTVFALLVFWASGGMTPVLLGAGMMPVVVGALRVGSLRSTIATFVLALAAPLVYRLALLANPAAVAPGSPPFDSATSGVLLTSAVLLLMGIIVGLPVLRASLAWSERQAILQAREADSVQLRTTRKHTRAIYEMSAALNANLNVADVLEAALDLGVLGLREGSPSTRPVSAVLLRDEASGLLHVAHARRMPASDLAHTVPGQAGLLADALRQCTPIFAHEARQDPELCEFTGFQEARSLLCVPLCRQQETFGVLVFGSTQPNAFSKDQVDLLTAVANQATVALQNARLYQDLVEEKERLLEVEEDARKQLSRELHDGPTQSVAAIAMRVNYIRRLLERQPEQVPPELLKVEELARQTSREIRHMLFTLRPLILETQGLVPALGELAKKMQDTYDQNVLVQAQPGVEHVISPEDQNLIFNIVDEAVNNARKHAEAEHIWIRLHTREDALILEIEDDGVGFDMGEVDANYDQRGSLGMLNLRERAELLGGTLAIESAEGRGTRVTLTTRVSPTDPDADETVSQQEILAALREAGFQAGQS